MPNDHPRSPDKPARKSRLFQARPDRLLVDEWVPSIALPAPPPSPLVEVPGEFKVDEHGMPELPQEREEAVLVGPARLYVGQGTRPAPAGAVAEDGTSAADYFVAELRLPRPEEGLPFGLRSREEAPDPWSEELALDGAELSDPDIDVPDLAGVFALDLDVTKAPEPPVFFQPPPLLPPPPGAEPEPPPARPAPSSGPVTLGPSPAREPLARRAQASPRTPQVESSPVAEIAPDSAPTRPAPTAVIRSKPSWTRARPLPAPSPAPTPQFQAREAPLPNPWIQRLVSWPTLVVLMAVLVAATALLVRGLST